MEGVSQIVASMRDMSEAARAGLAAAVTRFPASARQLEELIGRDEAFRGLCEDLAAAEEARNGIELLPEPIRADRRIECASWITGLSREIAEALAKDKVVSLAEIRRRPPA